MCWRGAPWCAYGRALRCDWSPLPPARAPPAWPRKKNIQLFFKCILKRAACSALASRCMANINTLYEALYLSTVEQVNLQLNVWGNVWLAGARPLILDRLIRFDHRLKHLLRILRVRSQSPRHVGMPAQRCLQPRTTPTPTPAPTPPPNGCHDRVHRKYARSTGVSAVAHARPGCPQATGRNWHETACACSCTAHSLCGTRLAVGELQRLVGAASRHAQYRVRVPV